ncbi:Phytocyanin domain-containing protein [Psidium guajava]|nr:Phytocyanin domain-containing protein [Psidium guajava]
MGRGAVSVGFLAVAMVACLGGAAATEYVVGGDRGWTAPPNITAGYYDEWAAGKNFTGGDSLKFVLNGTHDFAPVSREEYDNCTKVSLVFAGGEPLSYTLPANAHGPYYFICTVGTHCENGQKLAINVTAASASSTAVGTLSVLVLLLSSIIISMVMN